MTERKCYRLEKKEIEFSEIKKGDLFILDDGGFGHENGTVVNRAYGDAFLEPQSGVYTVRCSVLSKRDEEATE